MLWYRLGPPLDKTSRAFPEIRVRIAEDARRSVVFLGVEDDTPGGSGIQCIGTGFFVSYANRWRYLVTVKHVALQLSEIPFLIRINDIDGGGSQNLEADAGEVQWFTHSDPDVDLAVAPFQYDLRKKGHDVKFIGGIEKIPRSGNESFECGDFCYTIGLFQLLAGHKRNLPVVHFGTIALTPSDEKIPVRDWEKPHENGVRRVEGYLVESQSIQGLSGAPVFIRSYVDFSGLPTEDGPVDVYLPRKDIGFLGIWQGAWDAKPDDVFAKFVGQNVRVPVGMGVVVPGYKLVEILEMPKAKAHREASLKEWEANNAASTDSATAPPASDANPKHREDFTRLVGEAARKREPKD